MPVNISEALQSAVKDKTLTIVISSDNFIYKGFGTAIDDGWKNSVASAITEYLTNTNRLEGKDINKLTEMVLQKRRDILSGKEIRKGPLVAGLLEQSYSVLCEAGFSLDDAITIANGLGNSKYLEQYQIGFSIHASLTEEAKSLFRQVEELQKDGISVNIIRTQPKRENITRFENRTITDLFPTLNISSRGLNPEGNAYIRPFPQQEEKEINAIYILPISFDKGTEVNEVENKFVKSAYPEMSKALVSSAAAGTLHIFAVTSDDHPDMGKTREVSIGGEGGTKVPYLVTTLDNVLSSMKEVLGRGIAEQTPQQKQQEQAAPPAYSLLNVIPELCCCGSRQKS